MTYLTESRDVLAKTLYVFAHREGRDERARAWEFDTIPEGMKDQRYEWADALIASGAVIDASTLADDEALVKRMREHDHAFTRLMLRRALRALAAALTERGDQR